MGWKNGTSQISFGISCILIFREDTFLVTVNDLGNSTVILKHWAVYIVLVSKLYVQAKNTKTMIPP